MVNGSNQNLTLSPPQNLRPLCKPETTTYVKNLFQKLGKRKGNSEMAKASFSRKKSKLILKEATMKPVKTRNLRSNGDYFAIEVDLR